MFLSVSVPVRKPVTPAILPPVLKPNSVRSPQTPLVRTQSSHPQYRARKSSSTTATAMLTRSKTKGGMSQPLGGMGTSLSEDSTALASSSVPLTGDLDIMEHRDGPSPTSSRAACAINPPGDLSVVYTPKPGLLKRHRGMSTVRTPPGDLQLARASKPSTPDRPIWVPVLNPHPVLSPRISPARATKAPITIPKSTAEVSIAVPRKRGRPRKSQTQSTRKPVSKKVATMSKTKAQVLRVKATTGNNGDSRKPATPLQSMPPPDVGKSSGVDSRVGQPILPYVWVRDCKIGKGRTVQPGDQVSIRFKGRIQNEKGLVYDENVKGEPVRIFSISSKPA